jgi:hypothetical protein
MKSVFAEADAVLKAADAWVIALETLVAAKQIARETEAEQEAVDIAGSQLEDFQNELAYPAARK